MKHVTITETDDITAAIRDARYNVATAKLSRFEDECHRLGGMAIRNPHRKREVVDGLYDIAMANDLLSVQGGATIEDLIVVGMEAR
ncbi:hypothetical protein [Bradyrhizobium sp. McL0615]|uniref:hypothetical protein n=1 Tax=Bradyrhizobium sp. McL0615 TaxID=3415673 RepID=UPI003CEA7509